MQKKQQSRIDHMPSMGRINNTKGRGAWCADHAKAKDKNQYLQVDLGVILDGNYDQNTRVDNNLNPAISVHFIRFIPDCATDDKCMRVAVFKCRGNYTAFIHTGHEQQSTTSSPSTSLSSSSSSSPSSSSSSPS
ncbi:hypothetical protein OS493_001482 [Desmophyllum pertusum]|uniref:F5/8 type C domain-containing protein n=1 Tax=Desmophyllum pertusum TaxID=174260 RepID=A0A9W9ZHC5_9CNID|nr:hypothetical protein OS493_001482 [Desmophyllum pertusum]